MIVIQIAGNLGADPEVRFTPGGQKVTTLRVAAKTRKGSKEETVWWRVTIWGERFDKMIAYLKKGSAVIVIGNMHPPETYTDKEGQQRISFELTAEMLMFSPFGRPDKEGSAPGQQQQSYGSSQGFSKAPSGFEPTLQAAGIGAAFSHDDIEEDPLPF